MSDQGDQGHQSTQQGFDTIEANERMPVNHDTARTNTDLKQVPIEDVPRRRGGRPTARRGKPFACGESRSERKPEKRSERRQRMARASVDGQNTPTYVKKQPIAKKQLRLNPYARPFVSQQVRVTPNTKTCSSQQPAIGKHSLNPQAAPFHPATSIGDQGLNPQAAPFYPQDHIEEKRKAFVDPDAPPCLEELAMPKRVREDMSPESAMPVESTPQLAQQSTNTPEAAADPIIEQQRLEVLMERVAEEKDFARQRDAQEKLRLEEEQQIMKRREIEEQEVARRLEEEAWRRHQEEAWLRDQQEAWLRDQQEAWRMHQEEEHKRRAIDEQKMEDLIKRTAELTLVARQESPQDKEEQRRRQRALQEKLRLEEEQNMMALQEQEEKEKAYLMEAEALRRSQEAERKAKEEQEKARELEAETVKKLEEEVHKRKVNEEYIKEIATVYKMKQKKMRKLIQDKSKHWLSRSRHNIEKRNASIKRRTEILRFSVELHNNNPYSSIKIDNLYKTYKLRTPEIMKDRAKIALQSEKTAGQFNEYKNEDELMENIWKKENFNGFAHWAVKKKLYQPQIDGKFAWTHLISCDPTATQSIKWFSHKFDLDSEFQRKTSRYKEVDIATKLVDSTDQLFLKLNNEVEAITFVLPEKRVENERHDHAFWQSQRNRLAKLIEALKKERFDFQCPLLITYYSDGISDVHDTLYNIPELLGFKDDKTITDYHVLQMRKESITTRICDEMFWLFEASVTR